ncbi:hypothetical protein H2200_011179 [Cladophialophora chaetospira]|uniref:Bacteriophage T5 Orf172 DNA-binding domain-containing protein n=1 Tax=Cladophialophora chaetospira TaxID=386627 RepID=A0AA38X053_9EURO|nr:hypothetical protein H2200_011179 [Cladophialophora chaetospira]
MGLSGILFLIFLIEAVFCYCVALKMGPNRVVYLNLPFLVSRVVYLWEKLTVELRVRFLDLQRSFKAFEPGNGFECLCIIPRKKRKCMKDISDEAEIFAPILRTAILSSLGHPALPSMLRLYSRLCHCEAHQIENEANNASIKDLAERWESELKRDFMVADSASLSVGPFPPDHQPCAISIESIEFATGEDHAAPQPETPHGALLNIPEVASQDANRSLRRRNSKPSWFTAMPAEIELGKSPPFRPYSKRHKDPLHLAIVGPLTELDFAPGFVYVFSHPDQESFVKIGYTKLTKPADRWQEWRAQCKLEYTLHGTPVPTPFAKRVESLIFADLCGLRSVYSCPRCNRNHNEWFRISTERAVQVINHWVSWIAKVDPYQGATLGPRCVRWMFHDPNALTEESDRDKEQRELFSIDSNLEPWIDHSTILGKRARGASATPEIVASTDADIAAGTVTPSHNGRKGSVKAAAKRKQDKARDSSPLGDPIRNELSPPESLVSSTPLSAATRSSRRNLFQQGDQGQKAVSSSLSPPGTPALDDSSSTTSTPDAGQGLSTDVQSTPSKPSATRKQGSGRIGSRLSSRSGSVQTIFATTSVDESPSAASGGHAENVTDQFGQPLGSSSGHAEGVETATDAIPPLRLPPVPKVQNDHHEESDISVVNDNHEIQEQSSTGKDTEEGEPSSNGIPSLASAPKNDRKDGRKRSLNRTSLSRSSASITSSPKTPGRRNSHTLSAGSIETTNNENVESGSRDVSPVPATDVQSTPLAMKESKKKPARQRKDKQTANEDIEAVDPFASTSPAQRVSRRKDSSPS